LSCLQSFLNIIQKAVYNEENTNRSQVVGAGAGLGWLVLVFCERKTLLTGWFGLAETNKRTGCKSGFC